VRCTMHNGEWVVSGEWEGREMGMVLVVLVMTGATC
jgi:hypothetical protein